MNKPLSNYQLTKLAFTEKLYSKPELLEKVLDAVFNRHTTAGILGATAGGTGGLINEIVRRRRGKDKKGRFKRLLGSALAGGGLGYGASRLFPNVSGNINEALVDKFVRRPVGRYVTNNVDTWDYTDPLKEFKISKKESLGRAFKDRHYIEDRGLGPYDSMETRNEFPFRKTFGLEPRESIMGRFTDIYIENDDGTYRIDHPGISDRLPNMMTWLLDNDYIKPGEKRVYNYDRTNLLPLDIARRAYMDVVDTPLHFSDHDHNSGPDLRNFTSWYSPEDKAIHYYDEWDVGLNKGEKIDSFTNLVRWFMGRRGEGGLMKPFTIKGTIPFEYENE